MKTIIPMLAILVICFRAEAADKITFGSLEKSRQLQKELRLTPFQKQRMRQIILQQMDTYSQLRQPDVAKELSITEKQRDLIIITTKRQRMQDLQALRDSLAVQQAGGPANDVEKILRQSKVKLRGALLKILNSTQRARLKQFLGKPYGTVDI